MEGMEEETLVMFIMQEVSLSTSTSFPDSLSLKCNSAFGHLKIKCVYSIVILGHVDEFSHVPGTVSNNFMSAG